MNKLIKLASASLLGCGLFVASLCAGQWTQEFDSRYDGSNITTSVYVPAACTISLTTDIRYTYSPSAVGSLEAAVYGGDAGYYLVELRNTPGGVVSREEGGTPTAGTYNVSLSGGASDGAYAYARVDIVW